MSHENKLIKKESPGHQLISKLYYDKVFNSSYGAVLNLRGRDEEQERVKKEFIERVNEGLRSSKIKIEDLVNFLADIKISHAIESNDNEREAMAWMSRHDTY